MKRFGRSGLIYLILLLILLALTFWLSYDASTICWDGIDVDETLLLELCGINEEAYWEMDPADCPQSIEAVIMIGGCEPDYTVIATAMVLVALLYSILFLGLAWIRRRGVGA